MRRTARYSAASTQSAAGGRRGFTAVEMTLALTLLGVVMVLVARASYSATAERWRTAARQGALEAATNLLEVARARSWDALTPEWAAAQRLPEAWTQTQPDGKLDVQIEPEASVPHAKRVTVTIGWDFRPGIPPQEVQLVTLLSAREVAPNAGRD
jgi:prepilin-type N-terminal cleavage/methylation domain-containing protein